TPSAWSTRGAVNDGFKNSRMPTIIAAAPPMTKAQRVLFPEDCWLSASVATSYLQTSEKRHWPRRDRPGQETRQMKPLTVQGEAAYALAGAASEVSAAGVSSRAARRRSSASFASDVRMSVGP